MTNSLKKVTVFFCVYFCFKRKKAKNVIIKPEMDVLSASHETSVLD